MSRKSDTGSSGAAVARRQPLLASSGVSRGNRRGSRIGETAGECAAVCCCCPCTMVHLIFAVYRFPKGIWRSRRRKRLLRKKEKLVLSLEEKGNQKRRTDFDWVTEVWVDEDPVGRKNAVDWDNEMWDRFDGAGFWRSGSPRTDLGGD